VKASRLLCVLSAAWFSALSWLGGSAAQAQNYPTEPVKIIIQVSAGSTIDVLARIIAERLSRAWNQQVLVENRAGAGGAIASRALAQAPADGHTLFLAASSAFVLMHEIQANLPFDIHKDFAQIAYIGEQPMVIAAATPLGIKTLPELIERAKKQPGTINYAASTQGSIPHLTMEALRERTGMDITFVPYPGSARALNDLMAGQIQLITDGFSGFAGAVAGGTIRPIAVGSAQRLPNFPDLPTVAETVPGFTASGWLVMVAPGATPPAIIQKVRQDLNAILQDPEMQTKLLELGNYWRPMTPEQTTAFIGDEREKWRRLYHQVAGAKKP
jgi:tripartite-type tricarboxylate transporter receptor subunit TctC